MLLDEFNFAATVVTGQLLPFPYSLMTGGMMDMTGGIRG